MCIHYHHLSTMKLSAFVSVGLFQAEGLGNKSQIHWCVLKHFLLSLCYFSHVSASDKFFLADPTYMIRAIPANASDNVYCTLLAQSAVHGAMAGYTGFTVGSVNGRHAYIPFQVMSLTSLSQNSVNQKILKEKDRNFVLLPPKQSLSEG